MCSEGEVASSALVYPQSPPTPNQRRNETTLPPKSSSGTGKGFLGIFTPGFPDAQGPSADVIKGTRSQFCSRDNLAEYA